jgi:hypothetical protein
MLQIAIVSHDILFAEVTSGDLSLPGRLAGAVLDTEPRIAVLSVYVPSRDRSLDKTEKKQTFIASLLAGLDAMPDELRGRLIIGGDYNVIARNHQPLHPGFLPFEFGLLQALQRHGFVDAHQQCAPGVQAHSWIGRTGDGFRYDYFHVGRELGRRIKACAYLHETREQRLTDHAAVTLGLDVERVVRLRVWPGVHPSGSASLAVGGQTPRSPGREWTGLHGIQTTTVQVSGLNGCIVRSPACGARPRARARHRCCRLLSASRRHRRWGMSSS